MKTPKKWITIGKRGFSIDNIHLLINDTTAGIRINTGRSSFGWANEIIQKLNDLQYPMSQIYLDIANTKPRLSISQSKGLKLKKDNIIIIANNTDRRADAYLSNECFFQTVAVNDTVYFGDGEIECKVKSIEEGSVLLQASTNGTITNGTSIGIKSKEYFHFFISENEINAVQTILKDYSISLILSFVESKMDIIWAKHTFRNAATIVPKIETISSVNNFLEILPEVSTVFIGRGDLALSIGVEKIGIVQEELISQAHRNGRKVALGTGTLDSLRWNETPLRAEIIDITNSCKSNVDYIALTSETGGSDNPFKAISVLDKVLCYLKTVN